MGKVMMNTLLLLLCVTNIIQSTESVDTWTECAKSASHWTIKDAPSFMEQHRSAVQCISSCVNKANCRAVQFNEFDSQCGLYESGELMVVNGTEYESVAFIRNIKVVHASHLPRYMFTFEQAKEACTDIGGQLMTEDTLWNLFHSGYQLCVCGWLVGEKRMYPMQMSTAECGNHIGIVVCDYFETADAWCDMSGVN